jgi:hypothetical protein
MQENDSLSCKRGVDKNKKNQVDTLNDNDKRPKEMGENTEQTQGIESLYIEDHLLAG